MHGGKKGANRQTQENAAKVRSGAAIHFQRSSPKTATRPSCRGRLSSARRAAPGTPGAVSSADNLHGLSAGDCPDNAESLPRCDSGGLSSGDYCLEDGTCSDGKGSECAVVTSVRRHLRRLLSPNSNVMLIGKIVRPAPTSAPSAGPSAAPTGSPAPTVSAVPSTSPTQDPTHAPTATFSPTRSETYAPTRAMTDAPSYAPTTDTYAPSSTPTATAAPSSMPSATGAPTK